ncbi:MAG: MFS transporter [Fimbriimonadaceae bacterium]|uniref:MFS transporter n=1 Tax=Candidatus Nitrosymbiomonas proteolyticus TaxID=2608984 RepID=A0A809R8A0_9BACT|nr:MFS transporter [Fimbriimonadaceae bacterium]NUM37713.1 MFS transporter [Armatimonadota bacterium]BBO22888.1 MFS transporter [Candidatus Nitrosymbiomonas proteolyticus]
MEPPNRLQTLRTLRFATLDAAFATAFATLVTGAFLVGFVRYLGGSDAWVNLLVALPSMLGVLQIPGAIWGRGVESYKRFVLPGALIWRLLYLPLVALPLLPLPDTWRLTFLAVCVSLAGAAVLLVNPIYNDWLAELVPPSSRGWYFGRRQMIATAVGALAGTLMGLVLDAFERSGNEALGYSVVFGVGWVCAVASFTMFLFMRDLTRERPIRMPLKRAIVSFVGPLKDHGFRPVLGFLAVFVIGQVFPGNLFSAFALESLKMPFTVIQFAAATHALGSIALTPFWGYLADRYGNRPVLALLSIGLAFSPLMWLFCFPGRDVANAAILISGHVFSGAVWGGVALCQLNLLFATAKTEDRATYIGVGLALQAIVGGLAPLAGAATMEILRGVLAAPDAYKVVFSVTMGLRFTSVFFLLPVREAGSLRLREAFRQLKQVNPAGFRAVKRLARSTDPSRRGDAIRSAAKSRFTLAVDEIAKSLHDPSPSVRREAALALATMGTERAVVELVHQLTEHQDLVEEETIEALGQIGDPRALESLVLHLQNPRSNLRRAAAKALGKLGCKEAEQPLISAASDPNDADLRRSSLQALRVLGSTAAIDVVAEALRDPYPSLRIAAAEAVAEIGFRELASVLRETLGRHGDEAESEMAYALGAVGDEGDIPRILGIAAQCRSVITRRRCLLGVARIVGVESTAYRLFMTEGFERDAALLSMASSGGRRDPSVRAALDHFSSGDEKGALRLLLRRPQCKVLKPLLDYEVEESFLVAYPLAVEAR